MLGALIGIGGQPQLSDATQALHFGGVNEAHEYEVIGIIAIERDDVVDRIPIQSLVYHIANLV
jgi:hypothetical protein